MLRLEFILVGQPVSHQTNDRTNLKAWQAAVRSEAAKCWPHPPLAGKLKCVIIHVHDGDKPALDDDNMVKPIRDAMNGLVYDDDRQIRYSETIHLPIGDPVIIQGSSPVLLSAYSSGKPFVYVRIEDAPSILHLPGA